MNVAADIITAGNGGRFGVAKRATAGVSGRSRPHPAEIATVAASAAVAWRQHRGVVGS